MFKKPFRTIQGLLKGKDAKQLKRALQEQYPPLRDEALLLRLFPPKEEVTQHKVDAHLIIYAVGSTPVVFDVSGKLDLYPTVYALWLVPAMCRRLVIPAQVSRFLLNSADLMVPGLLDDPDLESLLANEKRCVFVEGNPLPFAVGLTEVSAREAKMKGKGRALKLIHIVYDCLWHYGSRATPPGFTPQEIRPVAAAAVEDEAEAAAGAAGGADEAPAATAEGEDGTPPEAAEAAVPEAAAPAAAPAGGEHGDSEHSAGEEAEEDEEGEEEEEETAGKGKKKKKEKAEKAKKGKDKKKGKKGKGGDEPAPADADAPKAARTAEDVAELDERCRHSFALGCARVAPQDLPMVVSEFFAHHMNAVRPAGTPPLEFRYTSWKKMSVFLRDMAEQGICTTKEQHGVFSITSINAANPTLKGWVEEAQRAKRGQRTQEQVDREEERLRARLEKEERSACIQIQFFYKPAGNLKRIFPPDALGNLMTDREACDFLVQYLQREGLDPSVADKSLFKGRRTVVRLDAFLGHELYSKKEAAPETEEVLQLEGRFLERLQAWHCIRHPHGEPVIQKGQIRPIQIQTATRMGNKTVTRILHVNEFGFDLRDLCAVLQRKFASSVSVPAPTGGGTKGAPPQYELLAQGDKVDEALDYLLNECKIPKKFIEVLDGKGKKH